MRIGVIVVAILALSGVLRCSMGCGPNYSDGERTGVVTKLSKKGLVYKSWEGEMNVGGMSATEGGTMVPTVWAYTVKADNVAEAIQTAAKGGKRVTLVYRQWALKPWFRVDTDYEVIAVK